MIDDAVMSPKRLSRILYSRGVRALVIAPAFEVGTTLDLEWSGAMAPNAALHFYGFASSPGGCPFQGFLDTVANAVNDTTASAAEQQYLRCQQLAARSAAACDVGRQCGRVLDKRVRVLLHIAIIVEDADRPRITAGDACPVDIEVHEAAGARGHA